MSDARPWHCLAVVGLTALVIGGYLAWAWAREGGNIPRLFHVAWAGKAPGWKGYDGQFVYFMAHDLHPERVAGLLDVPAYRYQRILLPLLAHLLGQGRDVGILLSVWGISVLVHLAATWFWSCRIRAWDHSPWWALLYGLWPGLLLGIRLGLPGPLMTDLALLALLAVEQERWLIAGGLGLLALMAKEQAWVWLLPAALAYRVRHARRVGLWLVTLALPWLAWQFWLWRVFDTPAVRGGGAGPSSLPWYPFGGLVGALAWLPPLWRTAYLLAFGPSLLLPLAWGGFWLFRSQGRHRGSLWWWLFLCQALFLSVLPVASWDIFAILRLSLGMLTGFWALAFQRGETRTLKRLLPFWLALFAFLPAR